MISMKNEIELRLIGGLLSDWCKHQAEKDSRFVYRSGFDSTHRIIRFTTATLQSLFVFSENKTGRWGNGQAVMYEIHNSPEGVRLSCIASRVGLNKQECARMEALASACSAVEIENTYLLAQWDISCEAESVNQIITVLGQLYSFEVAWFETELNSWKAHPDYKLRAFPEDPTVLVSTSELPDEIYMEGAQKAILINQYERNPKARARCIAMHGTACKVCGFDFGATFGAEFSRKIEVHHIKPISEIGEAYIIDPARDLVPVCPNCHMMLHSKRNGVFSIEELISLLSKAIR